MPWNNYSHESRQENITALNITAIDVGGKDLKRISG
jgi:hypothetical protein